jgi:hypothetical protein
MLAGGAVPDGVSDLRYFSVQTISYAVQWAAMPLLLYYACIAMSKAQLWSHLVVPYNWLAVWQMLLGLVSTLWLDGAGFEEANIPVWLLLVGLYVIAVMGWMYGRVLQSGALAPVLLVVLNIAVDWQLGIARFALLNTGLNSPPV